MVNFLNAFRLAEASPVNTPRGQIIINRTNFIELMKQRRWRNNVDVGKALGYTRQNIALVMSGAPVSTEFMARVGLATGTWEDKTYSHYFEIVPTPVADNHQRWNMAKYQGKMPYESHSVSAEFRNQDKPVEKKQYNLF